MRFGFFFVNTATTAKSYTLSLHDALPISVRDGADPYRPRPRHRRDGCMAVGSRRDRERSEEHTSELQSRQYLVFRLLLEKKKSSDLSVHTSQMLGYFARYRH